MLIKKNLNELNNSCINTYREVELYDNYKTKTIDVSRCCNKRNEPLKKYTYDEFLNIESELLLHELSELIHYVPQNHSAEVLPNCLTNKSCCIFPTNNKLAIVHNRISTACNLRCRMCTCYDQVIDKNLQKKLYFSLFNKLRNFNLETIALSSNGEPFFYKKETFDYLESLTLNDCKKVYFISNLTMLNESDILHLNDIHKRTGIMFYCGASIDGITEKTYKSIRGNIHFNKVIRNAIMLKELGFLLSINFVAQKNNLHELLDVNDFWKPYNIKPNILLINDYVTQNNETEFVKNSDEWKIFKRNNLK